MSTGIRAWAMQRGQYCSRNLRVTLIDGYPHRGQLR